MVHKFVLFALASLVATISCQEPVKGRINPPAGVLLVSDKARKRQNGCEQYGVYCGSFCCLTGQTCGTNGCCDSGYFDCGDGIKCCPYGTTCDIGSMLCSYGSGGGGGGGGNGGGGGSNPTTTTNFFSFSYTTTTTSTLSFSTIFSASTSTASSVASGTVNGGGPSNGPGNGTGSGGGNGGGVWGSGGCMANCTGSNCQCSNPKSGAQTVLASASNMYLPIVLVFSILVFAPFL
ncbi:hypothetical protein DM01DRAFT_1330825 [Hesseltinella vesiculosa]|uniref:Chitin-binding type-1 domain-containing protein n=1 Tax=Hesseltinella vesiculosa TaxID=101127 RepID=A0A1X2GX91_9FUNG|nr:hypothetical protein DM01DRAFT_1330825 [Hesseltinella vesiculosa]